MLARPVLLYIALGAAAQFACAQDGSPCIELTRFTQGETPVKGEEVAAALAAYLRGGANSAKDECAGIAFGIRAAVLAVSGHIAEAELDAQRSLDILGKSHASDDLILLRPLQTLALVRFELGKIALARQDYRRMQLIRTVRPYDRAIAYTISATLLRRAGRLKKAESEFRAALDMFHDAGRGKSADTASTLNALALAYIEDHQYDEARQALDREMTIINTAKDVVAMDRVGLLSARGVLRARRHQWLDAEQDLREALSIADREKLLYPDLAVKLLPDFAVVLRKVHRRADAQSIEARAASFRGGATVNAVVDVTDLSAESKLWKK